MKRELASNTGLSSAAPAGASPSPQRGVTMIELLITMAIAAIVLGLAAPNFLESMRANRARSAGQQLATLLNEARTEALKRNLPVLVCPSNDGATCLSTPTAAAWAGTVIACYDADGNGACDTSTLAAPNPIRVLNRANTMVQVSGPTSVIRFNGMGAIANGFSFAVSAGTASNQHSTIALATTGAVRQY